MKIHPLAGTPIRLILLPVICCLFACGAHSPAGKEDTSPGKDSAKETPAADAHDSMDARTPVTVATVSPERRAKRPIGISSSVSTLTVLPGSRLP